MLITRRPAKSGIISDFHITEPTWNALIRTEKCLSEKGAKLHQKSFCSKKPLFVNNNYLFDKDHYTRRILRELWKKMVKYKIFAYTLASRVIGKSDVKKPERRTDHFPSKYETLCRK